MAAEHDTIVDALLERYLHLLDDYTTLRADLNQLQVSMYQQLARANFTAERGIRYGQDYFDERMRASRTVSVAVTGDKQSSDSVIPQFTVVRKQPQIVSTGEDGENGTAGADKQTASQDDISDSTDGDVENTPESSDSEAKLEVSNTAADDHDKDKPKRQTEEEEDSSSSKEEEEEEEEQSSQPVDPLRWFGFIAPQPLRQTQANAIRAIEDIVPRLATVSAEMAQVEIEVRRARKRRAKAVALTAKDRSIETSVAGAVTV